MNKLRIFTAYQGTAEEYLANIAEEAGALRLPNVSLFFAAAQERLAAKAGEVATINADMEQVRADGFAAAVRLMSLDAPERAVFDVFTELSSKSREAT